MPWRLRRDGSDSAFLSRMRRFLPGERYEKALYISAISWSSSFLASWRTAYFTRHEALGLELVV